MVYSAVASTMRPALPSFSASEVIVPVRVASWPISKGLRNLVRAPANIRRCSSTGGKKPPRSGWPSVPIFDMGARGRK